MDRDRIEQLRNAVSELEKALTDMMEYIVSSSEDSESLPLDAIEMTTEELNSWAVDAFLAGRGRTQLSFFPTGNLVDAMDCVAETDCFVKIGMTFSGGVIIQVGEKESPNVPEEIYNGPLDEEAMATEIIRTLYATIGP